MNLEASLEDVYISLRESVVIDESIQSRMSPPLLIMPSNKWFESKDRVLVVGQETLGWKQEQANINSFYDFRRTPDSIKTLQSAYVRFCFAKGHRKNENSPFWRAYRKIRASFDASSEGIETNVLWTNLYRCSNDGKSWYGKNNEKERKLVENALREILLREIDVLKPTAIIFFTGPRYDSYLKESVDGDVVNAKIDDRFSTRQLAELRSNRLSMPIFRTYHPNYLQRAKEEKYREVIALIVHEIRDGAGRGQTLE